MQLQPLPPAAPRADDEAQLAELGQHLRARSPVAPILALELLQRHHAPLAAHSLRVASFARALAIELDYEPLEEITLAALLHDLGKLTIAPLFLAAPRPLTVGELILFRRHPAAGAEFLDRYAGDALSLDAIAAVRHHHERWDGEGYPSRLSGYRIPVAARIVSVADTLEVLLSPRAYQRANPDPLAELARASGAQLDPEITAIAAKLFAPPLPLPDFLFRGTRP